MARGRGSIELEGDWDDLFKYASKFGSKLDDTIVKGIRKSAFYIQGEIVKRIKEKKYKRNSELTLFLKSADKYGDTPLIRTGAMARAVTHDVISGNQARVGVLRMIKKGKKQVDFTNIAKVVHDGAVIQITDRMRRAFVRKMGAIMRKKGAKLQLSRGSGAKVIRIPPRRFIGDVFGDAKVRLRVQTIFRDYIREALFK